jgi:putative ABC transport system permease protein
VAGYLLGSLIAQFITKSVFAANADLIPGYAAVSLAVSLLLALVGSLGPMISVFKLDPVQSLRGE